MARRKKRDPETGKVVRRVHDKLGRLYPFPIRLEEDLRADLETLAKRDRRALGLYCVMALEDHVRRKREAGELPPMKGAGAS